MQIIPRKIRELFETRIDILFFYLFLMTSTLSIRKVIYFYKINNSFNEYTGVYIYLSDIFLLLTFISFILYHNKYLLSRLISIIQFLAAKKRALFKFKYASNNVSTIVPRGTIVSLKKIYTIVIKNYLVIFPLVIAFFSFISIFWSTNFVIASFRSIKLFEFILFYFYILSIVPHGTIDNITHTKQFGFEQKEKNKLSKNSQHANCSTWNNLKKFSYIIIIAGIIQSIIGISQFLLQQSIGLFWLKESIISTVIPGVAKVILSGHVLIRAYGLFPHPNIFGGYLVFSIIITLFVKKVINVTEKKEHESGHSLAVNSNYQLFHVEQLLLNRTFTNIILTIQGIALLLTFSKSAILALTIGLFYIFSKQNFNMFHVEHIRRKILLACAILILSFLLVKPDIYSLFIKSLQERSFYLNVSRGTILSHPIIGIGAGQFVFQLLKIPHIQDWQFQPVHNVFLLIANEYGIFIAVGFALFLFKLFTTENCSTPASTRGNDRSSTRGGWNNSEKSILLLYAKGILLSLIFIMMFDHYFWDIQQGQIMLWLILGLIARLITSDSEADLS